MKEIILTTILVMQSFALCHMIYQIYKHRVKFNALYSWILVVLLLPFVGTIIYFVGKNCDRLD
jgi:hypothetical protein